MNTVNTVARYVLGLAMLVFGANKFLHFMPNPELPAEAGAFLGALDGSGYIFPILGVAYLIAGLCLVLNKAVPFALMGSVWLVYALDYKLSVAVWVGMIAMAGLAAELGLLMLHYLDNALNEAQKRLVHMSPAVFFEEVATGAAQRIRPMLMTGSLRGFVFGP